ncbi:MAG: PorT family protein [Muribaculaceae bacterium]|nr:PorT family protein [Muribaculaceae bacterium]
MKRIYILMAMVVMALTAMAQTTLLDDMKFYWRLGYGIGGNAPLPMPATIRSLNKFSLQPNMSIGVDANRQIGDHWGILAGIRFENKGMHIDADVKNYHMEIKQGGETLAGYFRGKVDTQITQWMFTVPLQATFRVNKVNIKAGPYVSILTAKNFSGYAYDGYLRVDDYTGPKVNLGTEKNERGDYDFSNDMRDLQWGVDVGADWQFSNHFGLYADLQWGVSGTFKKQFTTIEQTLRPIYGIVGISYRIN